MILTAAATDGEGARWQQKIEFAGFVLVARGVAHGCKCTCIICTILFCGDYSKESIPKIHFIERVRNLS